jgi:glyoxylase-like metal-dependent hydrolase (beta-lactamase superfamily II)
MGFTRRVFSASLCAAAVSPGLARAQTDVRDESARVEHLAENVFAILHDDATDEWPHGNTGVIMGRRSVFVIDSCYLPSRARADIALIRRITDKPVSKLATTHWHFDHNYGAAAYREAFPNVELIAERETARWIELNQTYWRELSTAANSPRRAAIATLEQELARGAGEDGVRFSDEERIRRARVIAQRQNELSELAAVQIVTPERLFDGELRLTFEGTRIEIKDWGPANSPHDVTFWLPRERILFTGDIVVQSPLPYSGASWPVHWARVLRELEGYELGQMVPGHGPVMRDHTYTQAVRQLMETTLERVEALVRNGRNLQQVQEELNLDDVKAAVPEWRDASAEDWTYTRRTLAERAFVGVRGQGGR